MKFPDLALSKWQRTRDTILQYSQVVGEVRGALSPKAKHWWHINLRPDVEGLTTPPIPYNGDDFFNFKILMNFVNHKIQISMSNGKQAAIAMKGQSVFQFKTELLNCLADLGIEVALDEKLFQEQRDGEYDAGAVLKYWQALGQISTIFDEFKSGLREESSPINLWPHHFDMALVWFSGRLVPGVDRAEEESADEQISFGFSTGDEAISAPYFYISAYPLPEKLKETELPPDVSWHTEGWEGALLMYDTLVENQDPRGVLLTYMQTLFEAGKTLMR